MAGERGMRIGAIGGRHDARVLDPLHERVKASQMLLSRGRAASRRRVREFPRQLAADEIETAGARWWEEEGLNPAISVHL
jgi:hypothetical protein